MVNILGVYAQRDTNVLFILCPASVSPGTYTPEILQVNNLSCQAYASQRVNRGVPRDKCCFTRKQGELTSHILVLLGAVQSRPITTYQPTANVCPSARHRVKSFAAFRAVCAVAAPRHTSVNMMCFTKDLKGH